MYNFIFILFVFKIAAGTVNVTEDGPIKEVLKDYNKYAYPGTTENPTVKVTHALSVQKIDFNSKRLVIDVWSEMSWNDPRLTWDGQPSRIRLPMSVIWTPDLVLYNSPIQKPSYEPNAVISQNGGVILIPATQYETGNCKKNDDDVIECQFKFGSWTYDGDAIELDIGHPKVKLDYFMENPEYEIVDSSAVRNAQKYDCCPETYFDITYNIQIKARQ